jgi:hypothetical protein
MCCTDRRGCAFRLLAARHGGTPETTNARCQNSAGVFTSQKFDDNRWYQPSSRPDTAPPITDNGTTGPSRRVRVTGRRLPTHTVVAIHGELGRTTAAYLREQLLVTLNPTVPIRQPA